MNESMSEFASSRTLVSSGAIRLEVNTGSRSRRYFVCSGPSSPRGIAFLLLPRYLLACSTSRLRFTQSMSSMRSSCTDPSSFLTTGQRAARSTYMSWGSALARAFSPSSSPNAIPNCSNCAACSSAVCPVSVMRYLRVVWLDCITTYRPACESRRSAAQPLRFARMVRANSTAAAPTSKSRAIERARAEQLSQERIIAAALRVAKRVGFDRLTMRALAEELGVTPMAAYYYVKSKEELLELVADSVAAAEPPLPAGLPWDEQLKLRAFDLFDRLVRYPG